MSELSDEVEVGGVTLGLGNEELGVLGDGYGVGGHGLADDGEGDPEVAGLQGDVEGVEAQVLVLVSAIGTPLALAPGGHVMESKLMTLARKPVHLTFRGRRLYLGCT